jgi:micrococcal nuclease
LLALLLVAVGYGFDEASVKPLPFLATDPEPVSGEFTTCGPRRGEYCVVDGDTFKLGERTVRVLGIDAPEMFPSHCQAEAELGQMATDELRHLLNQGDFVMTGKVTDLVDKYGRDLRALTRVRPDGSIQSIAEDLLASDKVRRYLGGWREPWC